jgi:hypothetical protein
VAVVVEMERVVVDRSLWMGKRYNIMAIGLKPRTEDKDFYPHLDN